MCDRISVGSVFIFWTFRLASITFPPTTFTPKLSKSLGLDFLWWCPFPRALIDYTVLPEAESLPCRRSVAGKLFCLSHHSICFGRSLGRSRLSHCFAALAHVADCELLQASLQIVGRIGRVGRARQLHVKTQPAIAAM